MSTLHKVKAYFGMVPLDAYDDRYVDDGEQSRGRRGLDSEFDGRGDAGYDDYRDDRATRGYAYEGHAGSYDSSFDAGYRPESYDDGAYSERRYETTRYRDQRPEPSRLSRLEPLPQRGARSDASSSPATRGALALDSRADVQENPMSRITTLRPTSYEEARTIGERFREGIPVIMDLTEMDNADAKRLVDFAAGLTFALHGSFDRITTKVFMLATADVDVTAEERARIAETGFYNH